MGHVQSLYVIDLYPLLFENEAVNFDSYKYKFWCFLYKKIKS